MESYRVCQFLLYTGQIVLKNNISEECYNNFMTLNIAMLILLSPNNNYLLDYAKKLLNYFVKSFQIIYGVQYISHNVHNLLHICDDYEKYGPLDNCSAFCFENYMKELKSFLRKSDKPLQQVINRYYEKCSSNKLNNSSDHNIIEKPILNYTHTSGPLLENITRFQYYSYSFNNIKLNLKKEKDSYFLSIDNQVIKCLNIVQDNSNDILLIGKHFKKLIPLYEDPIDSSLLDIYEIKCISKNINCWPICKIKKKMMIFEYDAKLIAMPIIHTDWNTSI